MKRFVRLIMLVAAVGQACVAIGFLAQMPWTKVLWPFAYTQNLSFIFMSSIAAAAAVSTLWCLYTGEDRALAGIALDYVAIFGPVAVFGAQIYVRNHNQHLIPLIVGGTAGALFGIGLFLWSRRLNFRRAQPTPRPIRIAFGVFVVALFLVGGGLVLKTPNIMPWTLTSESSILYGWFFIGAAIYFIYGLIHPVWANAGGQLAGFLAYDLVLIVPFLLHIQTVEPEHQISLGIYIAVLVISGSLAVYYLFMSSHTRQWGNAPTLPDAQIHEKGIA